MVLKMRNMKPVITILLFALTLSAFGCSEATKSSNPDRSHAQPSAGPQADGSTVTISTAPNGLKSEVRTFESGEIARVTRMTYPNGTNRAVVEYRDGRAVELKDENDIGSLMDTSADHIRSAADNAAAATKGFGEAVADKTKEVGDKAIDKTKEGLEKAKDAAGSAAEAAGKGIKKAGKEIKKAGEKVKDQVSQ